ncbi:hypothetical protein RSAG8_09736, partial [Rhizoctonia solani AG-8 WAC10335]
MSVVQHRVASLQGFASPSAPLVEISTANNHLPALRQWAAHHSTSQKIIHNIAPEDAEELCVALSAEGIKLRYDWFEKTGAAHFRMPTTVHELVATWLSRSDSVINGCIQAAGVCGNYTVCWKGSASVQVAEIVGKKGSTQQPDGSFYLQSTDPKTQKLTIPGYPPRLVLEVGYSQELSAVLDKACRYLYKAPGKHVHAVVICDITPIDHQDPTVKVTARISVWIRAPSNDPAEDFPVDHCRHQDAWGNHVIIPEEPLHPEDASSSQLSTTSEAGEIYELDGQPGNMVIWNRSGWISFAEEGNEDQTPEELPLNIYDFVRVCSRYPNSYIPREQQEININLEWLQRQLLAEIPVLRQNLPEEPPLTVQEERKYPAKPRIATAIRRFIKRLTGRYGGAQV